MSDIRTDRFTLSEKDAANGGIYIPKVHHPSGPGFDQPLPAAKTAVEVDEDWDDGDEGPVDDPDPGYDGQTLF